MRLGKVELYMCSARRANKENLQPPSYDRSWEPVSALLDLEMLLERK